MSNRSWPKSAATLVLVTARPRGRKGSNFRCADTIRNSTIVSLEKVAEITLQVPLDKDLRAVVELLQEAVADEREPGVTVTALNGSATIVVRARAPGPIEAKQLESDLRIRAHEHLRAAGVFG